MTPAHLKLSPAEFRSLCRAGTFTGPTAGVAMGHVQANLVVLPITWAAEFKEFCRLNQQPCPLLETTEPGQYEPTQTASGADLRTDLPRYRVYRLGQLIDRPLDILPYWPDAKTKLVAFLLGCSFTFEAALLDAGIPVRHIEEDRNVSMYRTSIPCKPAGRFEGPLVVSMRPMTAAHAQTAARITAAMPQAHGAPIHTGDPVALGIADLARPDYGDSVTILPGEIPVFWACGVTPLEAILRAKPDLAIVHEPGHMFVTDRPIAKIRPGR